MLLGRFTQPAGAPPTAFAMPGALDPGQWDMSAQQIAPPMALPPVAGPQQSPGPVPQSPTKPGMFGSRAMQAPQPAQPAASGATTLAPGSPSQPGYDYQAALARMLPPEKPQSGFQKALSVIVPGLMALAGNQAGANQLIETMAQRRDANVDARLKAAATLEGWKHRDYAAWQDAQLRAGAPFTIGRDRLAYDPATGQVQTLFHAPADWQDYAANAGDPGSSEYMKAAQDYILRANGPTAYGFDTGLENLRSDNRMELQTQRARDASSLEGQRQHNRIVTRGTPTWGELHPTQRGSQGEIVSVNTPADAMKLAPGTRYRGPDGVIRRR